MIIRFLTFKTLDNPLPSLLLKQFHRRLKREMNLDRWTLSIRHVEHLVAQPYLMLLFVDQTFSKSKRSLKIRN